MVKGTRKAAVMSIAAGILAMGILGVMAVPVYAVPADPIWYLNCATPTLDQTNPLAISTCAAAASISASGLSGSTFIVGVGSNMQISDDGTSHVSGSYSLTDTTTATLVASGTFSGSGIVAGCSALNTVLGFGTANTGAAVASTDTLTLTLTFTSQAPICTGQDLSTNASTSIAVPAAAPEFGVASVAVAIGLVGFLALRRRALPSASAPL